MNTFKTTLPYLNISIGGNGIPFPSIIQIFGDTDTSKSSIATYFGISFLKNNDNSKLLYIDTEYKIDEMRFNYIFFKRSLSESVILYKDNDIDSVFSKIFKFLKDCRENNIIPMIVIDTVANLTIYDKNGDKSGYSGAKVVAKLTDYMTTLSKEKNISNAFVLVLNQIRDNVSGMGKKYKIPRGRHLKHIVNASIKLYSPSRNEVKLGGISFGGDLMVKYIVEKNHLFIPKLSGIFVVEESGVNDLKSLYEYCSEMKIFKKGGSWKVLEYKDKTYKFQNFEKFMSFVNEYPDIIKYIEYLVYKRYYLVSDISRIKLIDVLNEYEELLGLDITKLEDRYIRLYNEITGMEYKYAS